MLSQQISRQIEHSPKPDSGDGVACARLARYWEDLLEIRKKGSIGPIGLSYTVPSTSTAYVKLYHEARYSLHVRRVLDAWKTVISANEDGAKDKKVRPLIGAKLILVDEVSHAVGVC